MRKIKQIALILGISVCIFVLVITFAFFTHPTFIKQEATHYFPSYFPKETNLSQDSVNCEDYENLAPKLNDRYFDYIWNSAYQKFGEIIKEKEEIRSYYLQKKLILVDSSDVYVVDSLFHSFAFLTPDAKSLLDEIGMSFKEKLKNTSLKNARILVTSLLRTEKTVRRLMRRNKNSIRISSHLHGTTFDLAHNEFVAGKNLTPAENDYLKDMLAKTLYEFRENKKCYVTYEINQACFHVVNRKN